MKKMILVLSGFMMLSVSSSIFAGAVKDILIDTDDAITSEFFDNGLRVESIENHSFSTVKSGIGVKAEVETSNPVSKIGQSWTCIVTFQKINSKYIAQDVDCK
jgi:hypothetical protein